MSHTAATARHRTRAQSIAGSSISSASAPPSRGRTRRSIASEAPSIDSPATEASDLPPPPKRKRGRPSKKDLARRAQLEQAVQRRVVEVKQELAEVTVEVKQESMEVTQERLDVKQEYILERLEVNEEMLEVKQEPADFVHSTSSSSESRSLGSIRVEAELDVLQAYNNTHVDFKTERTEVSGGFREIGPTVMIESKVPVSAGAMGTSLKPATQVAQAQPTKTGGKPKGKSKAKNLDIAGQPSSSQIMQKRPARVRDKAPQSILQRAGRVRSQRMFLVDREKVSGADGLAEQFKVLGSTGNVYTVVIGALPQCNCPDCLKGNVPCKHIIFVFLKVLKVPESSTTWYQKGLLNSELQDIFAASPPTPNGSLMVSTKVRAAYLRATGAGGEEEEVAAEVEKEVEAMTAGGKRSSIGDDCPVCYEEMSEQDETKGRLTFDESLTGCGKPLHTECFKMWAATAKGKGDAVTCVWCRSPWPVESGGAAAKGKSKAGVDFSSLGYLNMADIAGVSRERDTSSYYWGPMRGQRMGGFEYRNRYTDE